MAYASNERTAGQFGLMPSWELLPAGRTPALGALLRVASRALPLAEVRGFVTSSDREKDLKPALAVVAVFGLGAVCFLIGVLDIGLRLRFLMAAGLFGLIALSAFNDLFWLSRPELHRVEILTASGETITYATPDAGDAARLAAALAGIVSRQRASPAAERQPGAECAAGSRATAGA